MTEPDFNKYNPKNIFTLKNTARAALLALAVGGLTACGPNMGESSSPEQRLTSIERQNAESIKKQIEQLNISGEDKISLAVAISSFQEKFTLWQIIGVEINNSKSVKITLNRLPPDKYGQFNQAVHDRIREEEDRKIGFFEKEGIYSELPVLSDGDQVRTLKLADLSKLQAVLSNL